MTDAVGTYERYGIAVSTIDWIRRAVTWRG
jgi:hypothetical protein